MTDTSAVHYSIGVDVGASNVRIGLLDAGGALVGTRKAVIRDMKSDSTATLRFIRSEAEAVVAAAGFAPADIGFIGLGFPGTVNNASQSISFAPNLGWKNVPVGEHFRGFQNAALMLVQDARAAAFGEYLLGAGRGEPGRSWNCTTTSTTWRSGGRQCSSCRRKWKS